MRQVWRCMWATDEQLDTWRRAGTPVVTAEHMDHNMTGAYNAGVERGKQQGRYEMRQDIEAGRIPPIQPQEVPSDV